MNPKNPNISPEVQRAMDIVNNVIDAVREISMQALASGRCADGPIEHVETALRIVRKIQDEAQAQGAGQVVITRGTASESGRPGLRIVH